MDNKPNNDQDDIADGRRAGADRRSPISERRRGSNRFLELIVSRSQMARDRRQEKRRSADSHSHGWGFWRRGQKKLTG